MREYLIVMREYLVVMREYLVVIRQCMVAMREFLGAACWECLDVKKAVHDCDEFMRWWRHFL
jgi:hypothetical protein